MEKWAGRAWGGAQKALLPTADARLAGRSLVGDVAPEGAGGGGEVPRLLPPSGGRGCGAGAQRRRTLRASMDERFPDHPNSLTRKNCITITL